MKTEQCNINLNYLEPNKGQIDGLPRNPRKWSDEEVQRIAASLKETPELFDMRPCIVIPIQKGGAAHYVILGGNLRYQGAKANGCADVPCIVLPQDTPVSKLKEIVIKDNGSFGAWDDILLAESWKGLPLGEWGVVGWDETEEGNSGCGGGTAKEDDFDETSDHIDARCQKGDIWQLGDHRLMCGDSCELDEVKKLMGGVLADMVFTDPPYGVAIGDKNATLNSVQKAGRCTKNIQNDTLSEEELYKVLQKAMENVRTCCKDDASYYVASPSGSLSMMMMMMMKDAGLPVRHSIVWNKNTATFSLGRLDYDMKHELILYTWTKSHHNYRKGKFRTSVWDINKPLKCDLHPTMKPIELVEGCMLDGTKEGDIILDVFGGSGTTLITAEQLGRKAYLMEIDPHYCDVIIARWEKATGAKALKII